MKDYKPPPKQKEVAALNAAAKASNTNVFFDWEDWLPYLETMDGTENQKRELIETLWAVILAFMDMGCEITSDKDGNVDKSDNRIDLSAALKAAVLESKDQQNTNPQHLEEV